MLNWTEEDVEFIVKHIINPCFDEFTNELIKLDEMTTESNHKTSMMLAERIRELDYEKMRDRAFFLSYLGKLDRLFDVNKIYKNFCEEYDKHNKHLLDTKSKVE